MPTTGPLDGIVVISIEQAVAGPFATRQLADLGATVIKVERPGKGDLARHYDSTIAGHSTFFVWVNRGKHSVALDIKSPVDRTRLDCLISGADVFLHNLAPASAVRHKLTAKGLSDLHPSLITCEISGYGHGGPRDGDKAYDLAIQAEAAVMSVTGSDNQISKAGFPAADIAAAMYAFSGILAALYQRSATGRGACLSISMLECLAEWMSAPTYAARETGSIPQRAGHRHAYIAPYGVFTLADSSQILIAIQTEEEWQRFCTNVIDSSELLDDLAFSNNEDRINNVVELETVLALRLADIDSEVIRNRLKEHQIANAQLNDPVGLWNHEQLVSKGFRMDIDLGGGGSTQLFPLPLSFEPGLARQSWIPQLDEHDDDLIQEILDRGEAAKRAKTAEKGPTAGSSGGVGGS